MSLHDYIISNDTGAAVRNDLNNALAAIVSNNSNATEPTTLYAYMWWADTTTGLLKLRNAANSAWVTVGTLASANLGLMPKTGGTFSAAIDFSNTDYMKIPVGNTAQRPVSPASGHIRYNTDLKSMEIYEDAVWINLGDKVAYVAKTANYTLTNADTHVNGDTTGGAFTLTLPTAVGITGKSFIIKKINSTNNILTIATTSSQTIDGVTTYELINQWSCVTLLSDGANWFIIRQILGTPISGTTVGVGGYAISASSGAYTTTSTSLVDVTNLSVTIKTRGRPVDIMLIPDGSGSASWLGANTSTTDITVSSFFKLFRDATEVGYVTVQHIDSTSGRQITERVPSGLMFSDFPSAGTHTYKLQAAAGTNETAEVSRIKLVVMER